ncbi:MAG: LptF/LptG family permease [Planctomycetaceae bacterium]|jgi:lipopolysaccharide export LptBFGC system permease protein LptF|nr:LptF/LptG family permease [Planctomycetaceae bacterium]
MTILDRYLLKSFFFNLIFWFICIIGIFIVFDLFTHFDSLVQKGKEQNNLIRLIGTYYLFQSIPIAMTLSSILGLVSAMIAMAMMIRNNELVPIQAAGISMLRIVRPLIFAVIFVAIVSTVLREAVLPHFLDELVMEADTITKDRGVRLNAIIDNETGISILGDQIYRKELRISNPVFVIPKPIAKQSTRLKAKNAFYRSEKNGHPSGFLLVDLIEIPAILNGSSLMFQEKAIVITHQDASDWVEENSCFVVSKVPFDYLASNNAWQQFASTWELFNAARNNSLDVGNRIHAIIHCRILQPFLDVILLFLGLPTILVGGDRNVFKAMGISGLVIITFLMVQKSCQYLGANANMPILGAWLPLMIFVPFAVNQILLLKTK